MLPGCCKNGIVISKIPVMQAGLKEVMRTHFPEYPAPLRRTLPYYNYVVPD